MATERSGAEPPQGQVQPYIVTGHYRQPVAPRHIVTGFLQSPMVVYWNPGK